MQFKNTIVQRDIQGTKLEYMNNIYMKIKLHEDIKQGENKGWKLEKWMKTVGLSIDENIDLIKGLKITEMYYFF